MEESQSTRKVLYYFLIAFAILYSLISFVNHFLFRTAALDLGLYTKALYDYAHFHWSDSTVMQATKENLLADHFDIYLILFSPLSFLFGSYTLLIVQIAAILIGGIGIYKYFTNYNGVKNIPLVATLHFFLFFGIFSALAFDYHSNVVAAMVVPWFFYFFRIKKYKISSILFVFILIGKENMALWMLFICLGLIINYRKDQKSILVLSVYSVVAVLYFITVVDVIMPAISNNNSYAHFNYSILGTTVFNSVSKIISNPFSVFKILFVNHSANPEGNYYKAELHLFVLFSGLIFLFFRPQFILMLIPIYFQKMFNDQNVIWSIADQYSIEFAPILTIGAFTFFAELKNVKLASTLAWIALILTVAVTIRRLDHTVVYTDSSRIRFYQKDHYSKSYDVMKVYQALSSLPANSVISSQSAFLPHLAMRDKVYQFPLINDARYIILCSKEGKYPLSEKEFDEKHKMLCGSENWKVIYDFDGIEIFERAEGRSEME